MTESENQETASTSTGGSGGEGKLSAGERLAAQKKLAAERKAAIKEKIREQQEADASSVALRPNKVVVDYDKTEAGKVVNHAKHWLDEHRAKVIAAAVGVVALLGLWIFLSTRGMAADIATGRKLHEGIDFASGIVVAAGESAPESRHKVYTSAAERRNESDTALRGVTTGPAAVYARLVEAAHKMEARDFAGAESAYAAIFAAQGGDPYFAAHALEGIAAAREAQNNFDGAIEKYQAIATIGGGRYLATSEYNVARVKILRGRAQDRAQAISSLRALIDRLKAARGSNANTFNDGTTLTRAETLLSDVDPTAERVASPGLDGLTPEQLQQLLQQMGQRQ